MTHRIFKVLAPLFIIMFISVATFSQSNDWENPQLYEVNKEAPHASFMLFNQQQDVFADEYSRSSYHHSLNGAWKFIYADKHADRIKDFYRTIS